MNQKSLEQVTKEYHKAMKKAMNSRDQTQIKGILKMKKEYEGKITKLEDKANKTMDPDLRRSHEMAREEYNDYTKQIIIDSFGINQGKNLFYVHKVEFFEKWMLVHF